MLEKSDMVKTLSKQHPELSACMKKWMPKMEAISRDLSKLIGRDEDDVVQDMMMEMWQVIEWYKVPRVRYEGHLWRILDKKDGKLYLERTFRGALYAAVVAESEVEIPNKSSLYTFVFQSLKHFFLNEVGGHFIQRNGFFKSGEEEKTIFNKWKKEVRKVSIPVYEHRGEVPAIEDDETGFSIFEYAASPYWSPDKDLLFEEYVDFLRQRVSDRATELLNFLLSKDEQYLEAVGRKHRERLSDADKPYQQFGRGTTFSDSNICSYLRCNKDELSNLRQELVENLPSGFLNYQEVQSAMA